MKIAIIGTRGIPNHYGGFEQFAEYLSSYLSKKGYDITVYNSHNHPYQEDSYNGVKLIHKFDPEFRIGTTGQFIYDLNCILDSRKRDFDCILQLGYTSSSIFNFLFKKNITLITNMDGLEWKRSKFGRFTKLFLKYAEKLAVKHSDTLVSDSIGIQDYLETKHNAESTYIAYGATTFDNPNENTLQQFNLKKEEYSLLIARLEPENNIATIIQGYILSDSKFPLIIIGNHNTKYGRFLKMTYTDSRIIFLGAIYDINILNNLRYFSNLYFHGHSVGGTNPSLLEAMASNCYIIANNNQFNKTILGNDADYFQNSAEVSQHVNTIKKTSQKDKINNNYKKIETQFNWDLINEQYETLILKHKA